MAVVAVAAFAMMACGEDPTGGAGEDVGSFADLDPAGEGGGDAFGGDATEPVAGLPGECQTNLDCVLLYPDIEPCEIILCDGSVGLCTTTFKKDYEPCEDGDACTIETVCLGGECFGGKNETCDDGNACTNDGCDPAAGCIHVPNQKDCDDGNPCTEGDKCAEGTCQSSPSTCVCASTGDCDKHDDDNPCNGVLVCTEQKCEVDPDTVITCGSKSAGCLLSVCDPDVGICVYVPAGEGTLCSDGDLCTLGDTCSGGICVPSGAADCDGDGVCSVGTCSPAKGCVYENLSGPCDDGNACTSNDTCVEGECVGTGNACECTVNEDCASQDNGNKCDGVLQCVDGLCQVKPGSIVQCDTSGDTPCVVTACDAASGECVSTPKAEGDACSDGDPCTAGDTCSGGVCAGDPDPACLGCTSDLECNDTNPCTTDVCGSDGECLNLPNTNECSDGDPCTLGDVCALGVCAGVLDPACLGCQSNAECDDGNPCTTDSCDESGACLQVSNTAPCNDGNPCTTADTCAGSVCQGTPVPGCEPCASAADCNDGNVCTSDACGSGGKCTHNFNALPCDDGDPCTVADSCLGGACSGKPDPACQGCGSAADCDDGNPCTTDTCGASGECANTFNTAPCSDGNPCTSGDTCASGVCKPGAPDDCDDGNACTDDYCQVGVGCVHLSGAGACCSTAADCDDGFDCTVDACTGGKCVHNAKSCGASGACEASYCLGGVCELDTLSNTPTVVFSESFDDGVANGWTLSTSNPQVYWSVSGARAKSGAKSLYMGNPASKTYDKGASSTKAQLPPMWLPSGSLQLRFQHWAQVQENDCSADVFFVGVNGQSLKPLLCESTGGAWVERVYDISAFAGKLAFITLFFDTYDGTDNQGEGIYVDNMTVLATAPNTCQ
jgi:hypothetical protein